MLNIALVVHDNLELVVKSLIGLRKSSVCQQCCISVVGNGESATFARLASLQEEGFIHHLRLFHERVCVAAAVNIAWSLADTPLYLWLPAGLYPRSSDWLDKLLRYWRGGLPVSTMNGITMDLPFSWPPEEEEKVLLKLPQDITGQAVFVPKSVISTLGCWNEDYEHEACALRDFALRMDCAQFPRYAYPLGALFSNLDLPQPRNSVRDERTLHLNEKLYNLCIRSWRMEARHELRGPDNDGIFHAHALEKHVVIHSLLEECSPVFMSVEKAGIQDRPVNEESILLWKEHFTTAGQACWKVSSDIVRKCPPIQPQHVSSGKSSTFRLIHNALIMPFEGSMDVFKAGVFDNGCCIPDSLLYRGSPAVAVKPQAKMTEPCIFGGYMFAHYGHFLLESLSRYYAIARCAKLPLLFLSPNSTLRLWQHQILKILDISNDILFVKVPTHIDTLIISPPACDARTPMHDEQFSALGRIPAMEPIKGKRIWISRSSLKTGGVIEEEKYLESILESEGWEIIHPEILPILNQARLIMTAEHVGCFDGSALYTILLCQRLYNNFIVFSRRNYFVPFMLDYIRKKGATLTTYMPSAIPTAGTGPSQNWSINIDVVLSLLHSTIR